MTSFRLPAIASSLLLSGLLFMAGHAAGDEIRYRVAPGDTLIGLGERLLAQPAEWPALQRLNGVADPYRIPVGTELRIPRALLRPQPRAVEVEAVSGAARADGQALVPGTVLAEGSVLSTGEDGHLALRLPDGSTLALPPRTRLRLDAVHGYPQVQGEEVRLRLEDGRVESRTAPQRGPAARFRVETPTAVIGVRGTEFRVATDPGAGTSRAEVTQGRVDVATRASRRALEAGFGLVAAGRGALGAPRALPPAPDLAGWPALFIEPGVRFALPQVEGVAAWRVQLAATPAFRPVLAERSGSGEVRFDGLPDGGYHLRVRTIDAHGLEGYDALHAFTLKARPEPPFPGQPRDAGKALAGAVAFAWSAAPEAAQYRFELTTGDFDEAQTLRETVAGSATHHVLEPGEYRWRLASVRADGDQGPWSTVSRLTVRPPAATPEPPELGTDGLVFRWAGEAGQRFEYQLSTDPDFASVLHSGVVDQPVVELPRPVPDTYFVRVRVLEADGFVGAWSGRQSVIVPADFPWWMLLLPLFVL